MLGLGAAARIAILLTQGARERLEFERLAASLGHLENVNPDHFDLSDNWKRVAHRLIDWQNSLTRQLRERQAGYQKLELGQRLAEAAQRRAEAVINSFSDAVVVTNSFGDLVLANPEAERLFQFSLDNARGQPVRDLIRQEAFVGLIEKSLEHPDDARRHTQEIALENHNKTRWCKVTASRLLDAAGDTAGTVTVLRDITSEKATQARSAEFVSAVSHEIKMPLASVKAYAEMLADGEAEGDPETQQKFLSIIETQTDRMARMLDGMLDLARIESGVVRAEKKPISLNEVIEGAVKLMQPTAAEKNITLQTQLSSLYIAVEADADMLSRVALNLVSNSIKYTDPGGCVVLRSRLLQERALLEVEDSGRGIPAEAMDKLFQKFYRVKENAGMAHGSGLGLSLVKHIVEELHAGRISVESEVGKGSVFRVELPLKGGVVESGDG